MSRATRRASSMSPTPPSEPGTTGMPSALAVRLASILSPMMRICSALGPMNLMPCSVEDLGEAGILGEEAVARMDGLGAGDLAGGDDGGNVEIAVARRRRADAHALIGQAHMHGLLVGGRMDGDGRDAELAAGAQDAQGDFAAIGDEDLVEHRLLDHHQGFAVFDRLAVLDEDLGHLAGPRRRDLVHRLHRLDDEQRLALA